jgi:hypothetical protein
LSCAGVTQPSSTRITSATGSSKLAPKARKITSTNSRYALMSGVIATMSGLKRSRKLNTIGSTRKYANAQPA